MRQEPGYKEFMRSLANHLVLQTHRVGSDGQTLLDQTLKGGLQDEVLLWDGLLQDLLCRDGLQRLRDQHKESDLYHDGRLLQKPGLEIPESCLLWGLLVLPPC